MKFAPILPTSLLVIGFAGCATGTQPGTVQRVDSPARVVEAAAERGTLVVYSAFEVGPPSPTEVDGDHRHHTDYEVKDAAGALVARVKNRAGAFGESPVRLPLPTGQYQVVARSNGSGYVTIPVAVAPARVTTLHLEAEVRPTGASAPAEYDLVRIASGRVVGWSTVADERR